MTSLITSLQHPLVKHLVKLRTHKKYRYAHRTVLIEGKKMVCDVCSHYPAEKLFVVGSIPDIPAKEVFTTNEQVIKKISGMDHPENIIAEVAMPEEYSILDFQKLLILDGISDPGNLGTLIRTALALNWDAVFLLNDCCDPYNDKALSAARGATFFLPIKHGVWQDIDQHLIREFTWVADSAGKPLDCCSSREKIALILGHEAHGVSKHAIEKYPSVAIPIDHIDSLNVAVAGGILMHHFGAHL